MKDLKRIWLLWFFSYMLLGSTAMSAGETSFLAEPVDHVDSWWVKLVFLNLPLQMVLALIAIWLDESKGPTGRRAGLGVGLLTTALIAANLAIAIYLELAEPPLVHSPGAR